MECWAEELKLCTKEDKDVSYKRAIHLLLMLESLLKPCLNLTLLMPGKAIRFGEKLPFRSKIPQ
jgi:hypothetical protein